MDISFLKTKILLFLIAFILISLFTPQKASFNPQKLSFLPQNASFIPQKALAQCPGAYSNRVAYCCGSSVCCTMANGTCGTWNCGFSCTYGCIGTETCAPAPSCHPAGSDLVRWCDGNILRLRYASGYCTTVIGDQTCPNGCSNSACTPCPGYGSSPQYSCSGGNQYETYQNGSCGTVTPFLSAYCSYGCSGGVCSPAPTATPTPVPSCPATGPNGLPNQCRNYCLTGSTTQTNGGSACSDYYGSTYSTCCNLNNGGAGTCPSNPSGGTNTCRTSCLAGETDYGGGAGDALCSITLSGSYALGSAQCCFKPAPYCPNTQNGLPNQCRSSCLTGSTQINGAAGTVACSPYAACCNIADSNGCPSSLTGGTNSCEKDYCKLAGEYVYNGGLGNAACALAQSDATSNYICCFKPNPTATPTPTPIPVICNVSPNPASSGQAVTLTASGGNGSYAWSMLGALSGSGNSTLSYPYGFSSAVSPVNITVTSNGVQKACPSLVISPSFYATQQIKCNAQGTGYVTLTNVCVSTTVCAAPTATPVPTATPTPTPTAIPTPVICTTIFSGSVVVNPTNSGCPPSGGSAYSGSGQVTANAVNPPGGPPPTSSSIGTGGSYPAFSYTPSCGASSYLTLSGVPYAVTGVCSNGVYTAQSGYTYPYTNSVSGTVTRTLTFLVSNYSPWFQVSTGDVRFPNLTNPIPSGKSASGGNSLFASSKNTASLGSGTLTNGWKVDSEYNYNNSFINGLGSMSYTFYLSRAKQRNIAINTSSISGTVNVSSLPAGVYQTDNSFTISGGTISNKHIIILAGSDVTITGPISAPADANNHPLFILAAKGNIFIDKLVGVAPSDPSTMSLQGYYTAEGSIFLSGYNSCSLGTDLRLNVGGALVANSLHPFATTGSGKIVVQRNICGGNALYPTYYVAPRPDFLLQMTDFYKIPYKTFKEVNP